MATGKAHRAKRCRRSKFRNQKFFVRFELWPTKRYINIHDMTLFFD